jgi:hypothetical protein
MAYRSHFLRLFALLVCALVVGSASAQEAERGVPVRDPLSLAQRYLGYERDDAFAAPTPIYVVGDVERFWVPRRGISDPQQIEARLVAAAPGVNVWVEEGVELGGTGLPADAEGIRTPQELQEAMATLGVQYAQLFDAMRLRVNFGEPGNAPQQGEEPLPGDFLPIPDVDSDPRMSVLYTRDLPFEQVAFYNPIDSIPAELVRDGRSNQREMILVNTSVFATAPLDAPIYVSAVIQAYLGMIAHHNYPDQPIWLQQLIADLILQQIENADPPLRDMVAYLLSPDTPLLATQTFTNAQAVNGAQQLFISYLFQEYGAAPLLALFRGQGSGISAVDAALRESDAVDAVTGERVTARALFADFVMANVLNTSFGDGRYAYSVVQFPQNIRARLTPLQELGDTSIANRPLDQFGTYYLLLTNTTEDERVIALSFEGTPTTPRLQAGGDERTADDLYYWSGSAMNANARMTRSLDLRAVLTASLTFDAWYSLPRGVDYAYVSVSDDGGETWTALLLEGATENNPLGAAYAPGLTGVSSTEAPRPFPLLGVAIAADGVTVSAVTPDGPAGSAGLQDGDVILGYDGQEWDRVPNIIEVLADFAPGDTITLIVARGEGAAAAQFDLPIVLGTFPTRTLEPEAGWLSHSVDLSVYAGKEILLRFETVTLPGSDGAGFAVDNLEIAEINFADEGASAADWSLEGFAAVASSVSQPFIIQAFVAPTQTESPSVQSLIPPGDPATSGEWSFRLTPNQQMIVAVSPASDETLVPATFTLTVDVEEPDA